MKTQVVFRAALSCLLLAFLVVPEARPFPTERPTAIVRLPQPPVRAQYWLMKKPCPFSDYTICCCVNGNSYACALPAIFFACVTGGVFECDPGYADCWADESLCDQCCPPCTN